MDERDRRSLVSTQPPERAVVLIDQDEDGIRITAVCDGSTVRTPALLSPDLARQHLVTVLPWLTEDGA